MPKIKFNYEIGCDVIVAGFDFSNLIPAYIELIGNCIDGSINTSQTSEFQAQYRDRPDTIETQVDMYGVLLDNVCERLNGDIHTLIVGSEQADEESSRLQEAIKVSYAAAGVTSVVFKDELNKAFGDIIYAATEDSGVAEIFLSEDIPLVIAYIIECLGEEKPINEVIQNTVGDYLNKLKSKELMDKHGFTSRIVATIEATLFEDFIVS